MLKVQYCVKISVYGTAAVMALNGGVSRMLPGAYICVEKVFARGFTKDVLLCN